MTVEGEHEAQVAAQLGVEIRRLESQFGFRSALAARREEVLDALEDCAVDAHLERFWLQQTLKLLRMFEGDLASYVMSGTVAEGNLVELVRERAARSAPRDAGEDAATV